MHPSPRFAQAQWQSIAEATPALVRLCDRVGAALYFNRRWLEFTGTELAAQLWESDLVGKTRFELATVDFTEAQRAQHQAALDARLPFRDFIFRRKDVHGTLHYISVSGSPLFDAQGEFTGYRGVSKDVTTQTELYLRRFPINALKIDRQFVMNTPDDQDATSITQAIIAMAHGLKLDTIAEGVETEAQLQFLRSAGCGKMQGYLFSRPLASYAFEVLVRAHQPQSIAAL